MTLFKSKRFRRFAAIVITAVIFALMPMILTNRKGSSLKAGIPEIGESNETGFMYEFKAGSFKLLMGKQIDNPYMKLKQGGREFEFTVFSDGEGRVIEPTPSAVQEENKTPEAVELTPTVGQSPATSSSVPTSTETPDEFDTETSGIFDLLSGSVAAQEAVELVANESEQYVYYDNDGLKVEPALDRVKMEFEITEGQNTPSYYIGSSNIKPVKEEQEIIFKTRTGRSSFAIKNSRMIDSGGSEKALQTSVSDVGNLSYMIGFDEDESWLTDPTREYPVTLSIEIVSLFHDRMLPVFPTKLNYNAFEPLTFEVDTAILNDSDIQKAFLENDLEDLKFGTIDHEGDQTLLDAKITKDDNDIFTLELWPKSRDFKPGIFDLLIQYKNEEAYIAEEDFTWGVVTINPDMSIYPIGSTANIDMAVLDKFGEMVCDAEMLLTITDPEGNITELSTHNGDITVSPTCHRKRSTVPDYNTSYNTSSEGTYEMNLSVISPETGVYNVQDSFEVDSDSPFYVRRVGPTRIYPILEYEMSIEVRSATDSGNFVVEERVPGDFEITDTTATVETPLRQGHTEQGIIWEEEFAYGQTRTLSYSFDAPDESPAIFLLGPLEILKHKDRGNAQGNEGNKSVTHSVFKELRSWQIANDASAFVQAATACNLHNSNSCSTGSITTTANNLLVAWCSSKNSVTFTDLSGWTKISASESVTDSIESWYRLAPGGSVSVTCTASTGTYVAGALLEFSGIDTTSTLDSTATPAAGSGDSSAECPSIGSVDDNNEYVAMLTYTAGNVTTSSWTNSFVERTDLVTGGGGPNDRFTIAGAALDSSSGTQSTTATMGSTGTWRCHGASFNDEATTPTTDQLMRHGNWFDSGSEQYFFWAD